jgi:hypothetical protein
MSEDERQELRELIAHWHHRAVVNHAKLQQVMLEGTEEELLPLLDEADRIGEALEMISGFFNIHPAPLTLQ